MPAKPRSRKPPVPRESEVQATAAEYLRSLGWIVMRRNTGAMRASHNGRERLVRFSEKGAADLEGIINPSGYHFELEIKRRGEWPRPEQVAWLKSRNGIGGSVAFWVDNIPDLAEVAHHVMDGGRIEFVGDSGQYRLIRPEETSS